MKLRTFRQAWLIALPIIAALYGCTREIAEENTVLINGLVYERGSDQPYTGIVVGESADSNRGETCPYKKSFRQGRLHGRVFYWYPNGKIESVEPYENGQLNGVVTQYYPNGQIKSRVHLVNGLRGGRQGEFFWNPDGSRS